MEFDFWSVIIDLKEKNREYDRSLIPVCLIRKNAICLFYFTINFSTEVPLFVCILL